MDRIIVLRYYHLVNPEVFVEPLPAIAIRKFAAPLREQVLESLRQAVIDGRLTPGERLVERELVESLGVSRTVIREALRQLETEGLVANIPNRGPVVRELSPPEAKDIYSIRAVLEGYAAHLFVENADADHRKQLAQALDVVAGAYERGDVQEVLETKNRFYAVLFAGAGSESLSSMLATLHARIWRWRALGLKHPQRSVESSRASVTNLRALLRAIGDGDGDAAEKVARREAQRAASEAIRLVEQESRRAANWQS